MPKFDHVDPRDGTGYQQYFQGYFQTVDKPRDVEEIQIENENPGQDNLTIFELTKTNVLRNKANEKIAKMQAGEILEKDLTIKDVIDPNQLSELESLDNLAADNEETNKLIEDIWLDFNANNLSNAGKLESQLKDEVN